MAPRTPRGQRRTTAGGNDAFCAPAPSGIMDRNGRTPKPREQATLMPKVLIIGRFHADGMKLIEARPDVAHEIVDGADEALVIAKIEDADGVTIRTSLLPGHVLDRAERLKVVSRHGVGYDNIDIAALTRRRIPLAIAADANATAVAEHTLYFVLALAKQGLRNDRATRNGPMGGAQRSHPGRPARPPRPGHGLRPHRPRGRQALRRLRHGGHGLRPLRPGERD